jgi:hypothetical protein
MTGKEDFDRMWKAVNELPKSVSERVDNLSRLSARAEVAGALEVVSSLPSAGEKGRLLYLSSDDLIYYDNGSTWTQLGVAGTLLGHDTHIYTSGNHLTDHSDWTPVDNTNLALTVTALTDLIEVHWVFKGQRQAGAPSFSSVDIGYDAGGGSYNRAGDSTYGLERLEVGAQAPYHIVGFFSVTAGVEYDFYLMDAGASPAYNNSFFRYVTITWWAIAR